MWPKNSADTRSAAEQHEVGWPLPAAVVASMEWMRNWLAIPFNNSISVSIINYKKRKLNPPVAKAKNEKNQIAGRFHPPTHQS